ncbi:MAG: hypothetical protein QW735_01450 [archaeon]
MLDAVFVFIGGFILGSFLKEPLEELGIKFEHWIYYVLPSFLVFVSYLFLNIILFQTFSMMDASKFTAAGGGLPLILSGALLFGGLLRYAFDFFKKR